MKRLLFLSIFSLLSQWAFGVDLVKKAQNSSCSCAENNRTLDPGKELGQRKPNCKCLGYDTGIPDNMTDLTLSELEDLLSQTKDKIEQKEEENENLKEKIQDWEKEKDKMNEEVSAVQDANSKAKKEHRTQMNELRERIKKLSEENSELSSEMEVENNKGRKVIAEVQDLQSSMFSCEALKKKSLLEKRQSLKETRPANSPGSVAAVENSSSAMEPSSPEDKAKFALIPEVRQFAADLEKVMKKNEQLTQEANKITRNKFDFQNKIRLQKRTEESEHKSSMIPTKPLEKQIEILEKQIDSKTKRLENLKKTNAEHQENLTELKSKLSAAGC